MSENRHLSGGAVLLGLILIAVGALVLLANLHQLPFQFDIGHWWPLILIILGLVHLWDSRNLFDFSGLFLVLLGGVFLAATLGAIAWDEVWRYWPAVLILLGVSILFKRHPLLPPGSGRGAVASGEPCLRVHNILAGSDRRVTSQEFKGGDVSNVLGGTEIDLLEARLAPGEWLLTVSTVLGGVEIRLPREWNIEVQPTNMLGSVDDHTRQSPAAGGGRLVIKASALLGGVEIKN
jgi:predicted membrane protein